MSKEINNNNNHEEEKISNAKGNIIQTLLIVLPFLETIIPLNYQITI